MLEHMEELLNALCMASIKKVMDKKKEQLIMLPLKEWLTTLKDSRIEASIKDTSSVEAFLERFRK